MASDPPPVPRPRSGLARDLALPSSAPMPRLLYGTAWKKDATAELVYQALRAGFRGVDTAAQPKHYREDLVGLGVGRAIAEGLVARRDLFIQTKFTPLSGQDQRDMPYEPDAPLAEQIRASVASSLAHFTFDGDEPPYLDALVLHSPLPTAAETRAAWALLSAYVPRQIRHLGISNAPLPAVRALCEPPDGAVPLSAVQNRFIPQTRFEAPLRALLRRNGAAFQSFWTLTGNPALLASAPVGAVADGAGVSREVALYALVLGLENTVVLDGTKSHMREDLEGVQRAGLWAEGEGRAVWDEALVKFKEEIGEEGQ